MLFFYNTKVKSHFSSPSYRTLFFFTIISLLPFFLIAPSFSLASQTTLQGQKKQKFKQVLDKKKILTTNNLYQIIELLPDGSLLIDKLEGKWKIHDQRFKNMSQEKLKNVKNFFEGKFIKIVYPKINTGIVLPAELYNPLCFSNDADQRAVTNQCPVILKP